MDRRKNSQFNRVNFLMRHRLYNPTHPTHISGLVYWFIYKCFFLIYFIYLLYYNENELNCFIFYSVGIKMFI